MTSNPNDTKATAESVSQKGRRLGGYFFWNVLEVVLNMGIMPLVLIPICTRVAGEAIVGQFLYAMGIVSLVGVTPTKGLNNTLLRDLSATDKPRQPLLVRTSMFMAVIAMAAMLVIALAICGGRMWQGSESTTTLAWVAILAVAFAARNLQNTGTVDMTVSRRFAVRMTWRSIGSILALSAVPAFYLLGAAGLPLGFTLGHVVALVLLLVARRSTFLERPLYAREWLAPLTKSWLVLSLVTFFAASGPYVHRTVLGTCHAVDLVTVFFTAAASLELCIMPVATLGLFGFQLLSAHRSHDRFSRRFFFIYVTATVLGVPSMYAILRFLSPWALRWLYANQYERAVELLGIMAIGAALTVLLHASRPFVQKFSSLRALGTIGIISLAAHLGAALLLIPDHGLTGAAWSYTIGHAATGVAWFVFLIVGFLGSGISGTATGNVESPVV